MNKPLKPTLAIIMLLIATASLWALISVNWSWQNFFMTPNQQGRLLMRKKEFKRAAARFLDPVQRGVALYRNGDFSEAAAAFGRDDSAVAFYDRGNALVLAGKYEDAIFSYERALSLRPDWQAARENLALARIRQERMRPPDDDAGGTGGKQEADEIVFAERAKKAAAAQQEQVAGGAALSDQELRALWLRRVENRPADFLRVKFLYQRSSAGKPGMHGEKRE